VISPLLRVVYLQAVSEHSEGGAGYFLCGKGGKLPLDHLPSGPASVNAASPEAKYNRGGNPSGCRPDPFLLRTAFVNQASPEAMYHGRGTHPLQARPSFLALGSASVKSASFETKFSPRNRTRVG
jgi:hypothetical protein